MSGCRGHGELRVDMRQSCRPKVSTAIDTHILTNRERDRDGNVYKRSERGREQREERESSINAGQKAFNGKETSGMTERQGHR